MARRTVFITFVLAISSLVGISSSSAATTCPTGTVVSTSDSTKCISTTPSYTPQDISSTTVCDAGDTFDLSIQKCVKAGVYIPAGNYVATPQYSPLCSSGTYSSIDGKCHNPVNPSITHSIYSPGTDCLGNYYMYLGLCHSVSNFNVTKEPDANYPVCQVGYTRSGSSCTTTITELLSEPTLVISGYSCNGVSNGMNTTCLTSGYVTASTYYDPTRIYSGTCASYFVISKTEGICNPYVFDPLVTVNTDLYKCVETNQFITVTTYYSYDASVSAPFGNSRTCVIYVSDTNSTAGIYTCTTTNLLLGSIYFYISDNNATGKTLSTITSCDLYVEDPYISTEEDQTYDFSAVDACASYWVMADWLACQMGKLNA